MSSYTGRLPALTIPMSIPACMGETVIMGYIWTLIITGIRRTLTGAAIVGLLPQISASLYTTSEFEHKAHYY
jgi:hypothetical protein